jgi:hypothetical protein
VTAAAALVEPVQAENPRFSHADPTSANSVPPQSAARTHTAGGLDHSLWRSAMRIRAAIFAGLLVALSLVAAPANAANQISGTANFAGTNENFPACDPPPHGFADFTSYDPIRMKGSLDGCWYTKILNFEQKPSGVYLESGEEVFVGSLNGGTDGIFTTTYKFEAKLDTVTGLEIKGRCQHKIVAGSGTLGFAGASGRVDFKDIIDGATVTYEYRGHISLATTA